MKHQVIQKIVLSLSCLALLSAFGSSYAAEPSKRTGKWETSFDMNYLNSSTIDFGGGNHIDTNSNMGWLIAFGYNFDEHLNLALDLGWKPVIGIPIKSKSLSGLDSLLSIVQMPPGVPVATVSIDGSKNAAILAVQILAQSNKNIRQKFKRYKTKLEKDSMAKNSRINI